MSCGDEKENAMVVNNYLSHTYTDVLNGAIIMAAYILFQFECTNSVVSELCYF